MTQSNTPQQNGGPGISLTGGAAIVAPITAFPNGVPSNALVMIPLGANGAPIEKQLVEGPMAMKMEDVWKVLGFNGPAVQVQDDQGRPIAIGLEDLLGGLDKHWTENQDDLPRGRIYAQELMKYGRFAKAEAVLSKIVAKGGGGEDWLALGVAQLQGEKFDKADATLKGAQNLLKDNPYPSLHMAKAAQGRKDKAAERENVDRAIQIAPNAVDSWAYLFNLVKDASGEEAAVKEISELADAPVNAKSAAPYIALQGHYAQEEGTREKAIVFAKKAVDRAPNDALALLCLSALYGQTGNLSELIKLLAPHEAAMQQDVRLAHNYFEALVQSQDLEKIKALLNKLAVSKDPEVKQFAIERSRAVAQMLQQQAQQGLPA